MKWFSRLMALAAVALSAAIFALAPAEAQNVPYNNPTYIPTQVLAPTTFTATGNYVFVNQGGSTMSVEVSALSGTLVAAVQGSNDAIGTASPTWTTLQVVPVGGGAPVTSLTANGVWLAPVAGFTQIRVHITTLSGGSHTVAIQAAATYGDQLLYSLNPSTQGGGGDLCQNPAIAKKSAVINVGAAATTKIVDTSGSTVVYVCGYSATLAGTTPTVVFKTGTHVSADCDTTPASLTGIFAPVTGTQLTSPPGDAGILMQSIAGGQICATTVGTGSSFQGLLTYVQQ